jgi:hypothetical protein
VDKKTATKNKILLMVLIGVALISTAGAAAWFNVYAPLILTNR